LALCGPFGHPLCRVQEFRDLGCRVMRRDVSILVSQEDPASLKGHSDRSKSVAKRVFEVMYTDALETLGHAPPISLS
jgi:hypothetical protein